VAGFIAAFTSTSDPKTKVVVFVWYYATNLIVLSAVNPFRSRKDAAFEGLVLLSVIVYAFMELATVDSDSDSAAMEVLKGVSICGPIICLLTQYAKPLIFNLLGIPIRGRVSGNESEDIQSDNKPPEAARGATPAAALPNIESLLEFRLHLSDMNVAYDEQVYHPNTHRSSRCGNSS
jgi:hypothetical protein